MASHTHLREIDFTSIGAGTESYCEPDGEFQMGWRLGYEAARRMWEMPAFEEIGSGKADRRGFKQDRQRQSINPPR
jgi:hypothetical protein